MTEDVRMHDIHAPSPRQEVVVVTGASAGLGRAIADRFARDGASIAPIARGEERLKQACDEVESRGGRALAIPLDVADADALENAADRVERELGPIDVWINNAMVSVYSPIQSMSAEEFRRVTEVTYLGYAYGTLAALTRMRPRDRGRDHSHRFGARAPQHPAAIGVLCGEACDHGISRVVAE